MKLVIKESIDDLSYEYLVESQFTALLNHVLIPKEVERTIVESYEEMAIREVIDSYLEQLTIEVCPVIATGCISSTKDKMEKQELRHMFDEFVDRMLLESAIENLSRLYEDEEAEIHIREQ